MVAEFGHNGAVIAHIVAIVVVGRVVVGASQSAVTPSVCR
jgi:hypothetical protein